MNYSTHNPPENLTSLAELLKWRVTHSASKAAFVFLEGDKAPPSKMTYETLHQRARYIAARLVSEGAQGERVLLCHKAGLEYVVAFFGCIYAGAVAVPAYPPDPVRPQRTMPRLRAMIGSAEARLVLTRADVQASVKSLFDEDPEVAPVKILSSDAIEVDANTPALPDVAPDAPAFLMYTSGSTGNPKGVWVTHANVLHNLSQFPGFAERPCETVVSWLPLFHDLGLLLGVLHPLYQGVRSVLMAPATFVRRPYLWLNAMSSYQATTSGGPNFAYDLCVRKITPEQRATLDLSHWNMALNGAEPVRAETIERFAETFAECGFRPEAAYPSYGMAEATATVTAGRSWAGPTFLTLDRRALESQRVEPAEDADDATITLVGCGRTMPDQDLRIVDPDTHQPCAPDEIGEIWVSGPSIAQGYWDNPEATKATFKAQIVGERERKYLRTGDLGFLRGGKLFITGRLKDLIIIRGINHYPEDIEHTVMGCHPAVRPGGGAAFSVEVAGSERLVLIQEVRPNALGDVEELLGHLRQRIAEHHDLNVYAITLIEPGSLLKTSSGKIRRKACRRAFLNGDLSVVAEWRAVVTDHLPVNETPPPSVANAEAEIRAWLVQYIAQAQGIAPEKVDPEQPFARYGLGSLQSLNLVQALEQWLGRALSPTVAWNHPSIAALARHLAESGSGSTELLAGGEPRQQPVAIVGMSCRFPGDITDPQALWQLLAEGRDTVEEIGPDRWDVDRYHHPQRDTPGKMVTRWGSHIRDLDRFDAAFFGISPREAAQLDPRQRLILEGAWEALEDAGIPSETLKGSRTGVFVGVLRDDYGVRVFDDYSIINAYSGSGTANAPIANRISYFLDLHGPSLVTDTACSGSLVAMHLACQSLAQGESTLALAGGINIILEPDSDLFLSKAGIISEDGRCKTFDSRANGIVRAEGMGLVVLKPLSQAVADGDHVYAVIRGSAVNHDGRSNGMMAPSGQAQELVTRSAMQRAGITPPQVQYIEAHGTGTKLGDPIEVNALGSVLKADYPEGAYCALGSVKTNIGHAEAAAGIASVIKVVLAMQHRRIPPNLNFQEPNPLIDFDNLPLQVQQTLGPWPRPDESLVAGVSGFGFSGTNSHFVLEAFPMPDPPPAPEGALPLMVPLSAKAPQALRDLAQRFHDYLGEAPARLYDIGYTAAVRRNHLDYRLTVVGDSKAALREQLTAYLNDEAHTGVGAGVRAREIKPVVFAFSGQGTHWLGMGQELLEKEPVFRATVETCDRILQELGGYSLIDILTNADALPADEARARLDDTIVAQPAIFAMQVALAALWISWGITPDVIVGQSLGEVAAAHVAGALTLEDAARIVYHRSRLMASVEGLGLSAILGLPLEEAKLVTLTFKDVVGVAGSSSPTASLISGDPEAVRRIVDSLDAQGAFARVLKGVTIAFHSPQMDPLVPELEDALREIEPRPTTVPLFSTVTGTLIDGLELDAAHWGRNLREPFVFTEAFRQLVESGYEVFLEVSPHPVLGNPMTQGLAEVGKEGVLLHSLRRKNPDRAYLLATLGQLYTMGYPINWRRLYPERGRVISLPTYPWQYERYWLDQIGWRSMDEQLVRKRGASHPLLGAYTEAAVQPSQHFWEMDADANTIPYIGDHKVQGLIVMPGAAYPEMALAAAEQALEGDAPPIIRGLTFKKGLSLPEEDARRIQAVLTPGMPGEATFRVLSRDGEATWDEHATCTVRAQSEQAQAPAPVDLDAVRARCPDHIAGQEHIQVMAERGLDYGPAFQAIQGIRRRPGEALAHVRLDDTLTSNLEAYTLHPILLDAAFQTVTATLADEKDSDAMFLPAGVETLCIVEPPGAEAWCHAVLRSDPDADPDTRIADLVLCDAEGRALVRAERLRLERVVSRQAEAEVRRALYDVAWEPQALPEAKQRQPGSWLIFSTAEPEPLAAALAAQRERAIVVRPGEAYRTADEGHTVWIDPQKVGDYARLLKEALPIEEAPVRGIVHRWSAGVAPGDLDAGIGRGVDSVRLLIHALAETRLTTTPRLWLVTEGAQAVLPGDAITPLPGSLWGMGRVLASEQPELRCTLVDLPPNPSESDEAALTEELRANQDENQVAWREGERYAARLTRYAPQAPDVAALPRNASKTAPFRLMALTRGVLDSLTPCAVPRPKPGPGEVEVEVYATGLNFKDVMLALGMLPPLPDGSIPLGLECAGRVTAVGEGVTRVKIGDEVLAGGDFSFSRYMITSEHLVGHKPDSLSFEECATLLVAFGTTHYALNRLGRLQSGERVLIHTASGAVGQAAIQLAKLAGAKIYATAGTPEKRAFLREQMGVEYVMDSRSLDFADEIMEFTGGEGVDVVLNTLSGAGITKSLSVLRPYGRFLELGKRDIVENNPLPMKLLEQNIAYFVIDFNQMMRERPERVGQLIDEEILPHFVAGELAPISLRVYPITEVSEAFRFMAQAQHIGKIVVTLRDHAVDIAPSAHQPPRIREEATYLITGGLGGLGRTVARHLAERGAQHLVLTSRRGRDALTPERETFVKALEAAGVQVEIAKSDVSEPGDVRTLINEIADSMPPLRGVIHAAGVLDDVLLLRMTAEQLRKVLAPKIYGAWRLHEATQEASLDFFVLFASLASLLGPQGQANYAAGNAFMDALAHARREQGLPALSIDWGPWSEVGMAARQNLEAQHAAGGVRPINPEQGVVALDLLLDAGATHVAAADIDWPQLRQVIPPGKESPFLADLLASEVEAVAQQAGEGDFIEEVLLPAEPEARAELLATELQALIAGVFHMDVERVDIHQPINTLGLDSIIAVELKAKIEKTLRGEVTVSITDLLKGPSAHELSEQFLPQVLPDEVDEEVAELLDEAESLSDEELAALLEEEGT